MYGEKHFEEARKRMVNTQLVPRGITAGNVLEVMGKETQIDIIIDPKLGERKLSGKVVPYTSDIPIFYE